MCYSPVVAVGPQQSLFRFYLLLLPAARRITLGTRIIAQRSRLPAWVQKRQSGRRS